MQVVINPATFEDLPHILKIQKEAFQYEAKIYQRTDLKPIRQDLESLRVEYSNFSYYKASIDEEVVGAVRSQIIDTSCHIERLIVSPNYQKLGIGGKLLEFIENIQVNVDQFELVTGEKSLQNIIFYQKRGYRIVREFKADNGIELVKMMKKNYK